MLITFLIGKMQPPPPALSRVNLNHQCSSHSFVSIRVPLMYYIYTQIDHIYIYINESYTILYIYKLYIIYQLSIGGLLDYLRIILISSSVILGCHLLLVGGWATPLQKWWSSSVGVMQFPIYWKIKFMFQTTNQIINHPIIITHALG